MLAPWDPDDRMARLAHGGVRPRPGPPPDHLVPLGRTLALPINGSTANLTFSTSSYVLLSRELRTGGYDVVHVHEPNAPFVSWCAAERPRAPLVATFHCYSTNPIPHGIAKLGGARRIYMKARVRIAVSEAARWTCERFYGGSYRVIPNGVDLGAAPPRPRPLGWRAARALPRTGRGAQGPARAPARLRPPARAAACPRGSPSPGPPADEVEPLVVDPEGVEVRGRVSEEEKWRLLHEADVLCAPRARRRELRHGADRGLRRGHAGGGLGGGGLPPGGPRRGRRACSCRRVVRGSWPRRCAGCTRSPPVAPPSGAAARAGAARFAWPSVAGRGARGLRRRPRHARARRRGGPARRARGAWCRPTGRPTASRRSGVPPLDPPPDLDTRRRGAPAGSRAARASRRGPGGRRRPRRARRVAPRRRRDPLRPAQRHAHRGARGLRAHVRVAARARRGVARHPARRPARARARAARTSRGPR